ncbi:unnamed protein product [Amoebophrya sp. A25]|nr:unnamed protein product [Amoebophrya sp. A25]|eukprot:GSA25T00008349001.1
MCKKSKHKNGRKIIRIDRDWPWMTFVFTTSHHIHIQLVFLRKIQMSFSGLAA